MADVVGIVLRFLHIWFGVAWIGAVIFSVGVLRRVMPRVNPAARKEFMRRLVPVVSQFMPGSAVMTILTGAVLYLWYGRSDLSYLYSSGWGLTLLAALVLALLTFGYGMVFGVASAKRILAHLEEEQCGHGPEVEGLTRRSNQAQIVVFALGIAIIALMVLATTHALG